MIKWFAAIIGYYFFRFPGAILGYLVGSLIDGLKITGGGGAQSVFGNMTRQKVSPADFELNLLSLCSIVIKADIDTEYDIREADVAIDFSVPSSAYNNISNCLSNNIPVISGTTGWLDDYDKAVALCKKKKTCRKIATVIM